MNKIYKVIWSKAKNCYVVVSELAKRNGKCKAAKTDSLNTRRRLTDLLSVNTPALTKAVMAMLLAGMVAMPGVSEAGIGIGVEGDRDNNKANIDPTTNKVTVDSGFNSIGIGYYANAGQNAVAIGGSQTYNGTPTIKTQAAKHAVAVGYSSQAIGENALTLGSYTVADSFAAIAVGRSAESHAAYAMAQGYTANANGEYSIALGYKAATTTTGTKSIAQGYEATASGTHSVALGSQLATEGSYAVGIGHDARARTDGSIAIGKESGLVVFSYDGTYSYKDGDEIKTKSITVTPATDTANGGDSIAIGNGAKNFTYGFDSTSQTYANTKDSLAIGAKTHTHAAYTVSIGANTDASGERALALGTSSTESTTAHTGARAAGQGSIAIGDQARAVSDHIEGIYTEKEDDKGIHAYDRARDYFANDAIAVGTKAEARSNNSIAIGGNLSYSYYDEGTSSYKTVYGKGADGRTYGAIAGDSADASIAIGGASGTIDTTKTTDAITVAYNPAGAFGARSIAIGTGALVESTGNHTGLSDLLNSPDYQTAIAKYETAKINYTQAVMDYNNARNDYQNMTEPVPPTITDPTDPNYDADEWDAYNTRKQAYDDAKLAYDNAAKALFGDASTVGAAQKLAEAAPAYEEKMALRRSYEEADATALADAIAMGTGAQTRAGESISLGNKALVDDGSTQSVAIGSKATVKKNASGSVAIGEDAQIGTDSVNSIAIGNDANTGKSSTRSIAIGYHAMTKSDNSVVDSVVIGTNSSVTSTTGIAIGSNNQVAGIYSGVIGSEALDHSISNDYVNNAVSGDFTYVIGNANKVGKQETEKILRKEGLADTDDNKIEVIKRDRSTARTYVIGARNVVAASGNTDYLDVYGYNNKVDEVQNGTVIGEFNTIASNDTGKNSKILVIGTGHNFKHLTNSLIIGGHETPKVTAVEDLKDVLVYGFETTIKNATESSIAIGKSVVLNANQAIAIGTRAQVGEDSTTTTYSIAIGTDAKALGTNSISIGTGNVVTGEKSGAIGDPNYISGTGTFAVGDDNGTIVAPISTNDTFILGNKVTTTADNSVFLGSYSAYSLADNTTTAGLSRYNSMTVNINNQSHTYTFAGGEATVGVVSVGSNVGGETQTRRIQHVAPGLISAESTDAINGSQLYQAMQALSVQVIGDTDENTKSTAVIKMQPDTPTGTGTGGAGAGGGADTPGTGTGAPTTVIPLTPTIYEVKASTTTINNTNGRSESGNLTIVEDTNSTDNPKSYKYTIDLAKDINIDTVTAGDTVINKDGVKANKFTAGNTTINNDGLTIAGGSSPVNLTNAGLKVGGTTVNDNGVTIQNGPGMTKDGIDAGGKKITNVAKGEADTDAVNVGQMKDYAAASSQAINDLGDQISRTDSRSRKGIAGAAALAALHPMDFDPDDKLTFAAGVGNFRGETAAAIGAFYRPDEKVMFSIGGTFGNSENLVNAGISFSLDRKSRVTGSRTAMAKEIVELREQVAQLTALVHQIAGNQGLSLPMPPAMFPNTPENKWAYDYIESLQKQGVLSGYAGRELTRNEMAAALDRALASGAKLDERITREFAPELSRIRVVYVNGQVDGEPRTFERPRSSVHEYK